MQCFPLVGRIQRLCLIVSRDLGGKIRFSGKISTVKCFENNPLVRKALEEDGHGRVLVVDGGGSLRCALLGDNIAEMAYKNGWDVRDITHLHVSLIVHYDA